MGSTQNMWILFNKKRMTSVFFAVTILLAGAGLFISQCSVDPVLCPGFELSQSVGPIYVQYDPSMTFESFYYKTTKNTSFLYVGGRWTLDVPFNNQIFVTSNSTVDLYTNNFFYPLLKDQALPLNKTFLGNFKFPDGELVDRDYASYIKYLGEGLLTTYHINSNTIVYFTGGQDITDLSTAFLEWYNTWAYTDEFKHYKSLYAPINRVIPSWVELLNFSKDLYSDTSMLLEGDRWEDSRESSFFSTID